VVGDPHQVVLVMISHHHLDFISAVEEELTEFVAWLDNKGFLYRSLVLVILYWLMLHVMLHVTIPLRVRFDFLFVFNFQVFVSL